MKICFVVRSLFTQVPQYTTTHLAYEAFLRGHRVYYTTVNSFSFADGERVWATVVTPEDRIFSSRLEFLVSLMSERAPRSEICLSDFDVVFLRYNPNELEAEKDQSNPAIDFGRLLKAHGVFVANDPVGLTKASSKMYLSSFPQSIRAKTLVSRNPLKLKDFVKRLRRPAILKPLCGFGGQDVFLLRHPNEVNINQIIASVSKNGYVMAQEYLPAVRKGDKRLLLLNGTPIQVGSQVAIYRRLSPKGDIRSNIHVGGTRKTVEYTAIEERIVDSIRTKLVADGLYFVGVDIVGDKLLEVNVFCPGGINNINELYGINVGQVVIEDLERRTRFKQSLREKNVSTEMAQAIGSAL